MSLTVNQLAEQLGEGHACFIDKSGSFAHVFRQVGEDDNKTLVFAGLKLTKDGLLQILRAMFERGALGSKADTAELWPKARKQLIKSNATMAELLELIRENASGLCFVFVASPWTERRAQNLVPLMEAATVAVTVPDRATANHLPPGFHIAEAPAPNPDDAEQFIADRIDPSTVEDWRLFVNRLRWACGDDFELLERAVSQFEGRNRISVDAIRQFQPEPFVKADLTPILLLGVLFTALARTAGYMTGDIRLTILGTGALVCFVSYRILNKGKIE